MIKMLSTLFLTCLTAMPAFAEMAHITADRDATLIEDAEGGAANGSGTAFFAGHTNQSMNSVRRALVHFDVAAALPEKAHIDRVFLSLYQNSNNEAPSTVSLHKVLEDWGEGASFSSGGSGATAVSGDVTWLHSFYDYQYWVQQGGHFIPNASATEVVGGRGFYTWQSTVHMISNVQHWLHAPHQNFGWLVMGDEETGGSVKRFDSRESSNSNQRPMLSIEYHLPGK